MSEMSRMQMWRAGFADVRSLHIYKDLADKQISGESRSGVTN